MEVIKEGFYDIFVAVFMCHFLAGFSCANINPFMANVPISYPENIRKPLVFLLFFRRYKVAIMARNGSTLFRLLFHFVSMLSGNQHATIPLDRGRKLNVDNTFRKSSRHLLNVLLTFSLRPLSRGITGCRISECSSAWCPLKGHTYLNKPAAESYRFI